jgi:hypothetical protein
MRTKCFASIPDSDLDVLTEISDAVRMTLASIAKLKSPSMMIQVFDLHEGDLL